MVDSDSLSLLNGLYYICILDHAKCASTETLMLQVSDRDFIIDTHQMIPFQIDKSLKR